jgi:hypothetical protein
MGVKAGPGSPGKVCPPKGGAYVLRDKKTGKVMRGGQTNNHKRREGEHSRDRILGKYRYDPVYKTDDYATRRGLEQMLHDKYDPPLDKQRPIDPRNREKFQRYLGAARRFLDGLEGNGE